MQARLIGPLIWETAMSDETMHLGSRWCRICRRSQPIEDTDTQSVREYSGEREYRLFMLACGHTMGTETGEFSGYGVDANGMPYL